MRNRINPSLSVINEMELIPRNSSKLFGSGSCEKDSSITIIAIEKEEKACLMH
jgi:hypothetical protein